MEFFESQNRSPEAKIFEKRQTDTDKYPATSSSVNFPFYLSDTQAQQLMVKPVDLMPKQEDQKVDDADAKKSQ